MRAPHDHEGCGRAVSRAIMQSRAIDSTARYYHDGLGRRPARSLIQTVSASHSARSGTIDCMTRLCHTP